MFTSHTAFFLYAESSVHVGSGQALGTVDLAIQREIHTQFPVVPASGLKGALRHWFAAAFSGTDASERDTLRHTSVFGPDTANAGDHAGAVSFSDARLLLFPMRSVQGVFTWVTCPSILHRFRRDLDSVGQSVDWSVPSSPKESAILSGPDATVATTQKVVLDEYVFFRQQNAEVKRIASSLAKIALPQDDTYSYWRERLAKDLLIVDDETFRDFTLHSTEVQARIKIDEETGTTSGSTGNLFYQENLPPESVFYALTHAQDDLSGALEPDEGTASRLLDYVRRIDGKRLQIGGDASIGKGVTNVHVL